MWFKQIKVFEMLSPINQINCLEEQLKQLTFEPCSTNMPFATGWAAPQDEEEGMLVYSYKHYKLICLQIEEKVVPTYVIQQELATNIKQIEINQQRTVSNKEKMILKQQIYSTLLPKAFSKINKIYAYFDLANKWLVLNTINLKKIETFLAMLQKVIEDLELKPLPVKNLTTIMTNWLQQETCPKSLSIENTCVLKEPMKISKLIRCQGQDLFSQGIKIFLKEGYQVDQIVITWQDQMTFVLKENFSLGSVRYGEQIIAATKTYSLDHEVDRFAANFIIMTGTLHLMINNLLTIFNKKV